MKISSKLSMATIAVAGMWLGACATARPAQLVEAEMSYMAARDGLPANLAPHALSEARTVLERAGQEFTAHGDTNVCRDYSYIAQNKLELAEVTARAELDRQTISRALQVAEARDAQASNVSRQDAEPVASAQRSF